MRIISQDGRFDLPYEQCGMQILQEYKQTKGGMQPNGYSIRAHFQIECGTFCMGNYATEAKALEVMEMLRKAYIGTLVCEVVAKNMLEMGMQNLISHLHADGKPQDYFQFPHDDEIEVSHEEM